MKPSLVIALLFAALLPGQSRDLLPVHWVEDTLATDDSIQKCLAFQTVAGVAYRVESSNDLVT